MKAAAERIAREDGVSLNLWISTAVAEKVGAVESAADFFKRRADGARPADMQLFLDGAADEALPTGDDVPESS